MTLRITSSFLLLLALAGVACSTAAPTASPSSAASKNKDDTNNTSGNDTSTGADKVAGAEDAKPGQEEQFTDFLMPFAIHTGFTGGAEQFRVPLSTDLTGTLTWKVADPSIASVASSEAPPWYADFQKEVPDVKLSFGMLTAKKAGTTKVTVSNGTKEFESEVSVTAYTSAQITAGKTRYKTGEGTANRQPCAGCHEAAKGPPHDPGWVAELSDDEVLHSVQVGSYDWEGKTHELNGGNHKWNLTEAEKKGILGYLRSLNPDDFSKL
jgi:hypothetical protein